MWSKHPNFVFIPHNSSFIKKVNSGLKEVARVVSLHHQKVSNNPIPVTAAEEASVDTLDNLMREHGLRHVPIVRGKEVIGVVSERDRN